MKFSFKYFTMVSVLLLFVFFSCTKAVDPVEPEVKELVLETLQENFPANGAVSIDDEGNIYVSEYGVYVQTGGNGTRVFKLSPEGEILETLENLSGPMGTKKDSQGNLFINNDNNNSRGIVMKIDSEGNRSDFATVPGWPSSMAIDGDDNLFITNYNSPTIHAVSPDGTIVEFARDERLRGCVGIDFDSKGNLIVGNFFTALIMSVSKEGVISDIVTLPDVVVEGWGIGYLTVVDDVIYTTGIVVSKIFKVSLTGEIEWFAGTGAAEVKDGPVLEASISNPNGISADKKNKILYISEYGPKGGVRKLEL